MRWTTGLAFAAAAAFYALAWSGPSDFHASIDFNRGAFEDFLGPYYGTATALFETGEPAPGFMYSPFFALLLAPLSGASAGVATWTCIALQVLSIGALLAVSLRLSGVHGRLADAAIFVTLTSFPLVHAYHWGQVGTALTALVLGAHLAWLGGRRWAFAGLLGLAIAVKFYPALFLVLPLLRGDLRTAGTTALVALVLLVPVPAVALGGEETLAFYRTVFASLSGAEAGPWAGAANQQYLPAVAARLFDASPRGGLETALRAAGLVWALGNVLWARHLLRGGEGRLAPALAVVCASLPLVVAPSWPHYFTFLPFCQATAAVGALRGRAVSRGHRALACGALALSVAASSALSFRLLDDPERFGRLGFVLVADLAVLVALYALGADASWRRAAQGRGVL